MAIKIDLLPVTVALRRRLQRVIMLSLVTLALAASALVLVLDAKQKEYKTAEADRTTIEARATLATNAKALEDGFIGTAKAKTDTIGFMLAASKSGPERAALLNQVRQYVYEAAVVSAIDLSDGKNLRVEAQVKDPNEYANFLFNLRRASATPPYGGPLFAALPRAGGVEGFPNGAYLARPPTPSDQPIVFVYPLKIAAEGPLKYPVVLPPDPVGAKTANAGSPSAGGGSGSSGGGDTRR